MKPKSFSSNLTPIRRGLIASFSFVEHFNYFSFESFASSLLGSMMKGNVIKNGVVEWLFKDQAKKERQNVLKEEKRKKMPITLQVALESEDRALKLEKERKRIRMVVSLFGKGNMVF